MPRPIRGGFVWDEPRIRMLADMLRRRLSGAKMAQEFNASCGSQLTKGNIESALRNKTVPARLRQLADDAETLLADYRDPTGKTGRPRKTKDAVPRTRRQAVPPGFRIIDRKSATERLLALRSRADPS